MTICSTEYGGSETTIECGIFNYLGSLITHNARCTRQIKAKIAMARTAFNKQLFSPPNCAYI